MELCDRRVFAPTKSTRYGTLAAAAATTITTASLTIASSFALPAAACLYPNCLVLSHFQQWKNS